MRTRVLAGQLVSVGRRHVPQVMNVLFVLECRRQIFLAGLELAVALVQTIGLVGNMSEDDRRSGVKLKWSSQSLQKLATCNRRHLELSNTIRTEDAPALALFHIPPEAVLLRAVYVLLPITENSLVTIADPDALHLDK